MSFNASSITHKLSKPTPFFGLKLWITIVTCIGLVIVLIILFICWYFISRYWKKPRRVLFGTSNPIISKNLHSTSHSISNTKLLNSCKAWDIAMTIAAPEKQEFSGRSLRQASGTMRNGTGGQYMLREIEAATNGLTDENVIGSGDYGIVYRGVLLDNTRVAVKKLFISNRFKDEDFMAEVEAMWCIRHKNLVKLLGYCAEGTYRFLVYEYIENGNLQQWLHNCIARVSPLTWDIRMNIILRTATGLAYLHDDTEPEVVHQHIKSSNILLDRRWNPKISDFRINKLLGPDWSHDIAYPMGMSGYIAPEYEYTGVLDKKSDVYSFGILIMEIVSGKTPIEYSKTEIEMHLIDWIKHMVVNQEYGLVVDQKLQEVPSLKELKRVLLIALRCVDPDVNNRPKIGELIHMLEPRDLLLADDSLLRS